MIPSGRRMAWFVDDDGVILEVCECCGRSAVMEPVTLPGGWRAYLVTYHND